MAATAFAVRMQLGCTVQSAAGNKSTTLASEQSAAVAPATLPSIKSHCDSSSQMQINLPLSCASFANPVGKTRKYLVKQ
jgi:hypothetical protein